MKAVECVYYSTTHFTLQFIDVELGHFWMSLQIKSSNI